MILLQEQDTSRSTQDINEIRLLNCENLQNLHSMNWSMGENSSTNETSVNKEKDYIKGKQSVNQTQSSITGKDRPDREYQN